MVTATQTDNRQLAPFKPLAISFEETAEKLREIASDALTIQVTGLDDKVGIKAAHESRMQLVKLRTNIEKQRKAMKADAIEYGKKVDGAAKELTAIIEPAEAHLLEQESIVKREEDRIAREKAEHQKKMIQSRLELLQRQGVTALASDVENLSPTEWEAMHENARAAKAERDAQAAREKAEQERIAAEQKAEQERLEKERAELERQQQEARERTERMQARVTLLANLGYQHSFTADQLADMGNDEWGAVREPAKAAKAERDKAAADEQARLEQQRKEQEAEQARIDAEKKRLEEEAATRRAALAGERLALLRECACPGVTYKFGDVADLEQGVFDELLAKQRDVKRIHDEHIAVEAKREAEEKATREAEEAKAKAEAEEAERQRIEAARPDAEKLLSVASAVKAIEVPELSENAVQDSIAVQTLLMQAAAKIEEIAKRLTASRTDAA